MIDDFNGKLKELWKVPKFLGVPNNTVCKTIVVEVKNDQKASQTFINLQV